MQWIRELRRNPFFRRGVARGSAARWCASLAAANLAYVGLFLLARLNAYRHVLAGMLFTREFRFWPWLLAGLALLSFCAHWLAPPLVLRQLPSSYDLPTLALMVRERRTAEEALRGGLAAALAPLCVGALPLALGAPLLWVYGRHYLPPVLAALAGALLWGGLCAAVSTWVRAGSGDARWEAARAYGWTCMVLPVVIGALSMGIARWCSADRLPPQRQWVFNAAAGVTWSVLVVGCAATFWDLAHRRFFPEKHVPLWQISDPGARISESLPPGSSPD